MEGSCADMNHVVWMLPCWTPVDIVLWGLLPTLAQKRFIYRGPACPISSPRWPSSTAGLVSQSYLRGF